MGDRQTAKNEAANQRYSNLINDSQVFLAKLREFKPRSLGSLEARRKSSSTMIFPNPLQSCMGPPKCPRYPHSIKPTTGYWIECHGPGFSVTTKKSSATMNRQQQNQRQQRKMQQSNDILSGGSFYNLKSTEPCSSALSSSTTADFQQHRSTPGLQSSASQERFVTSVSSQQNNRSFNDELSDDSGSTRPNVTGGGAPIKRQQSLESLSQKQQQKQRASFDIVQDDCQATTIGVYDYEKTGNNSKDLSSKEYNDLDGISKQQQSATSVGVVQKTNRKRLKKRIMTRDDIDLHKPRRGTPNITITEPSFNQSITSPACPASKRGIFSPLSKQISQGGFTTAADLSNKSSASSTNAAADQERPGSADKEWRAKRHLEKTLSRDCDVDGKAATRADSFDCSKPLELISSDDESCRQSLMSMDLNEADQSGATSSQSSRPQSVNSAYRHQQQQQHANYQHHYHHASSSINPYHRPSVIPEDSTIDKRPAQGVEDVDYQDGDDNNNNNNHDCDGDNDNGNDSTTKYDQGDYYCKLSTTTFHKQSFRQLSHQEQQAAVERFRDGPLELISFEEENYEKYYYGCEHWNYFTNDDSLGPVMLSLKQEVNNQRDHFHVLLRTVSYTLHGTVPASAICANRYDKEAIVRELSEIAKLKPALMLAQLPSTPDDLLKLDRIFIKTELKVGVIYIKDGQADSEEAILGNKDGSPLFEEFLDLLGDRITLKGFDKYKGGLDTVHNLTGTESIYTQWRNIEIMFHVSTMLPHEENDPQKLQKKRHIGNDIVCVAFIESDDILFWPGCIKSWFLHTFITVGTSPKPVPEGEKRKYYVSCVCRNEVQYAFKPYLVEKDEFYKSDCFREWLLTKIVNGERASYSAPKFARMQDRTRMQLLEDMITNLANHLMTGQIPKPYRRGSWRPLGHTRASSPLEDSMKDYFEDYDQLAKDYNNAFCGSNREMLCDVVFKVKDKDDSIKLVHGVRAIMAIRSRTFLEMLFGFVPPGTGATSLHHQTSLRAIEMKALQGDSGIETSTQSSKSLLSKRGSFGADSGRKIEERERRQSMLPGLSKPSTSQKPNYLTVPSSGSAVGGVGGAGQSGSSGTGGMIRNAFNRLVSGNWSGWSGVKSYKGDPVLIKVDQNRKVDPNTLAICKEIAKFDSDKLSQREFEIKEFDYDTFKQTIEYIHSGQCKLSYETIPGLICAAEHYDLHDLLHACFHHANTHMKLGAAPRMMNSLYQNSCFYITAMQLLDSIYEFIDPQANEFFSRSEFLELDESVLTALLSRKSLQVSELKKFQAMQGWVTQQMAKKLKGKQEKEQQQQEKHSQQLQRQDSTGKPTRASSIEKQESNEQVLSDEQKQMTDSTLGPIEENLEADKSSTDLVASSPGSQTNQNEDSTLKEIDSQEYRNLLTRLVKAVNIKLDKITNEDIVKYVLPTRVFSNDKIFDAMADESRFDY